MNFEQTIQIESLILTECAIAERLRRMDDIVLHPTLFNTPLIYDDIGGRRLRNIYGQYRNVAARAKLPILLCAPTWRVDKQRTMAGGMGLHLNRDAVQFMRDLQKSWHNPSSPVYIGGLIGPKNDCYSPQEALSIQEAQSYHRWQSEELIQAGVDCIVCQTIPAVSEALGLAQLLGPLNVPYLISFVINRKAEVLDGTPLKHAIATIDKKASIPPGGYMVNCAFPSFVCANQQEPGLFKRLIGIQANASSLDHSQLDGSESLHKDSLESWGEQMLMLNRTYGVKILGGCCGTDDTYLRYLVSHQKKL